MTKNLGLSSILTDYVPLKLLRTQLYGAHAYLSLDNLCVWYIPVTVTTINFMRRKMSFGTFILAVVVTYHIQFIQV